LNCYDVICVIGHDKYKLIMADVRNTIRGMLEKGQDPKEYLIEVCRPQCIAVQQKLQRCEIALKNMTNADP